MVRRSLKVLHTADVHLGWDGNPDLVRRGLIAAVDTALDEQVDLVLLAGDLFDSNRQSSTTVDFALAQLARLTMPLVMIPGNHDAYDATSIYRKIDVEQAGAHVRLLREPDGEMLHLPELSVVLWGRALVDHYHGYRPLEGLPERSNGDWHIALAHGHYVPPGEPPERSSPIRAEEIACCHWDYLAFGHWHPFTDVSQGPVPAVYSGSPARMAFEMGAGHVALVYLDPKLGVRVEPRKLELPERA
ncbi:MAG: metallophosphoesterase [Chloroflexi bacterium]|nr:metallophosphoesterase [Chloroflexota bacterium]